MSIHNLCFGSKIKKEVYPCTPQYYYIKVGLKGYTLHGLVFLMVIVIIFHCQDGGGDILISPCICFFVVVFWYCPKLWPDENKLM